MNSRKSAIYNHNWVNLAAALLSALLLTSEQARAISIQIQSESEATVKTEGIFSRMSDELSAPERIETERHQATVRKQEQLQEAEQEFQQVVQEDVTTVEKNKRASVDKDDEKKQVYQPRGAIAQTAEDSQINIGDLEANIQAKINAGATKAEILASLGQDEINDQQNQPEILQQKSSLFQQTPKVNGGEQMGAPNPATPSSDISKEKVRLVAKRLDIPFTKDLLALGSNEAISDALIEQAMANGKTDAEINEAMAAL